MAVVSIRLNKKEKELIRKFAETRGSSMSSVMKQAVFSLIEDEIDLNIYKQTILMDKERTYPHTQVLEKLDIE